MDNGNMDTSASARCYIWKIASNTYTITGIFTVSIVEASYNSFYFPAGNTSSLRVALSKQ